MIKYILPLLLLSTISLKAGPFDGWPDADGVVHPYRKSAPAHVQGKIWKSETGVRVKASANAAKIIAPITPYHFGNNLSWWMGKDWALNKDRLDKARQAGIRFWRAPGGSSSDNYVWHGGYGRYAKSIEGESRSHMNDAWTAQTDDFIEICRLGGAQAIFTANYGMARWGSLSEALALAKSWVRYTNFEKKFKIRHWEVGNENYGSWESGTIIKGKPDLTGKIYGADFKKFVSAMKSADPDIYVGAVAVNEDDGVAWTGYKWWMRDMLPQAAASADFLAWHEYFIWPLEGVSKTPKVISNEEIFSKSDSVGESVKKINAMVAKYGKRTTPLPIALTEYNILNGNLPQTIQLINALFTAEVLGEAIKHGIKAANFWDWINGYDPTYGGGDHGMLSAGKDSDAPESTPRPSYYAFALLNTVLGESMIESQSGDSQVKIYASLFEGGEWGLVLVNEKSVPVSLEIELASFRGQGRANLTTVTGTGLNSKKVAYNGVYGAAAAGGPFPIDTIAPYSFDFSPEKSLKISLPGACLAGMILR